jgi:hypothetical protein
MHGLRQGKVALTLCLFGLSQSGCDIVQGFRDASSAVFPDEKTYFDAPGFRLVRGEFRQLEFASGSSLYLLARPADREDSSLYVMKYADPRPCVLPKVKDHWPGAGVFLDATTIAFTEEGTRVGTLRFADGDCNMYPLSVNATYVPFGETAEGFLTYQNHGEKHDLVMINPVTGVVRTIAAEADLVAAFSAFYVIVSNGRIGAFKPEFTEVAWIGDMVTRMNPAGSSFFYEDRHGIHRLQGTSADSVHDTLIAEGGCRLGFPRNLGSAETWVTYHFPCDTKKLVVYGESVGKSSELDINVDDPHFMAFLPAYPAQTGDPAVDPFYTFYLAERNDANTGKLWLRTPDRQTKVLGEHADIGRLSVVPSAAETHGYALVDVNVNADGDTGRFIRWETDGSTRDIATKVLRNSSDLVTNYDGKTGQFQLFSDAGLSVVSRRIPPSGFKSREPKGRWTAIIDDYDEPNGTLSITESALDLSESERTLGPPPNLEVIARNVLWDGRTRFVPALPGIGYFTHYDKASDTGRLDYRNLELRFTATVSDGVADYLATPGGLIYSVPYGDGAGIWVVRSR